MPETTSGEGFTFTLDNMNNEDLATIAWMLEGAIVAHPEEPNLQKFRLEVVAGPELALAGPRVSKLAGVFALVVGCVVTMVPETEFRALSVEKLLEARNAAVLAFGVRRAAETAATPIGAAR